MRRTTLPTLAAACALFVTLAGCGGDPQPKFTKSASPTHTMSASSASPTPTDPTPPEMPAAAKKHTVAGAKAFTRYFIDSANYAALNGDATSLRALASQYCDGCQAAIRGIEKRERSGAVVSGGGWSVVSMRVVRLAAADMRPMKVTIRGRTGRQVVTYRNGRREVYKPARVRDQLILSATDSGWLVTDWRVLG